MARYPMVILGALLIGWSVLPSVAEAQMICGDRAEVVARLERNFAESPNSMGLASNSTVIEVFASASGSWTLLMTLPTGVSCVLAAGEDWEILATRTVGPTCRLRRMPSGLAATKALRSRRCDAEAPVR